MKSGSSLVAPDATCQYRRCVADSRNLYHDNPPVSTGHRVADSGAQDQDTPHVSTGDRRTLA
eukprot:2758907-Rhodomonas_salina.1